jgi:hypothetical protein
VSKKLLSYDPGYVRGETCLLKWQEGDGPMPENPVPCQRPAVAGVGLTRSGEMVHPADRSALADMFVCDQHVGRFAEDVESGEVTTKLVPKTGGRSN